MTQNGMVMTKPVKQMPAAAVIGFRSTENFLERTVKTETLSTDRIRKMSPKMSVPPSSEDTDTMIAAAVATAMESPFFSVSFSLIINGAIRNTTAGPRPVKIPDTVALAWVSAKNRNTEYKTLTHNDCMPNFSQLDLPSLVHCVPSSFDAIGIKSRLAIASVMHANTNSGMLSIASWTIG